MRRCFVTTVCALGLVLAAGCSATTSTTGATPASGASPSSVASAGSTPPGTAAAAAVQKDVLATEVDPPGAPGRTLTLIRYTIPAGAKLAPHIHPGVQLASIQSGTLTYTVISGTAEVTRAGGPSEPVTGPTTIRLDAGDAVAEKGDMVHFGANETGEPVVILATLLTEDGRDLAVPVTTITP